MRPIICSDTSMELQPAALHTAMPRSLAAARSSRSTPTPVRHTTLQRSSFSMISRVSGRAPWKIMPSAPRPASASSSSLAGLAITISASASRRMGSIRSTGTSLLPQ